MMFRVGLSSLNSIGIKRIFLKRGQFCNEGFTIGQLYFECEASNVFFHTLAFAP